MALDQGFIVLNEIIIIITLFTTILENNIVDPVKFR
jgi:hypothetical protein